LAVAAHVIVEFLGVGLEEPVVGIVHTVVLLVPLLLEISPQVDGGNEFVLLVVLHQQQVH
jgi:hypothetical protein